MVSVAALADGESSWVTRAVNAVSTPMRRAGTPVVSLLLDGRERPEPVADAVRGDRLWGVWATGTACRTAGTITAVGRGRQGTRRPAASRSSTPQTYLSDRTDALWPGPLTATCTATSGPTEQRRAGVEHPARRRGHIGWECVQTDRCVLLAADADLLDSLIWAQSSSPSEVRPANVPGPASICPPSIAMVCPVR